MSADLLLDVALLGRERDRDVMDAESGTPCTCTSRTWSRGSLVILEHDGCWKHDEAARQKHLGIAACENCEADELVSRMDGGGWCRVCAHEAGPVEGPFTPEIEVP